MIPYKCDAPIYHWPIATVVIIGLNVVAFVGLFAGNFYVEGGWLLEYGTGIHPQQWLLSMFMHADVGHLLGNMIFLWVFGLITEGKLGWWRFLLCYLAIGVGQSAVEQMVMSGSENMGGSLGASAAIFGLMAMACVWAPANEVSVAIFFYFRPFVFEIPVGILAAIYVGMDLLSWMFWGDLAGSSILHLMGAAFGAVLGVVLLKTDVVDCENWDIFSVRKGEYGSSAKKVVPLSQEEAATQQEGKLLEAQRRMFALIKTNQPVEALALKRKMIDIGTPLELSREEMLGLIVGLHKLGQWKESAPIMMELLQKFPEQSEKVRLKLAQICLVEFERPTKALSLLEPLAGTRLGEAEEKQRRKLVAYAQKQIKAGVLEMEDESW